MDTTPIRRRHQHLGVLSDDMWQAHGRLRQAAMPPREERDARQG